MYGLLQVLNARCPSCPGHHTLLSHHPQQGVGPHHVSAQLVFRSECVQVRSRFEALKEKRYQAEEPDYVPDGKQLSST